MLVFYSEEINQFLVESSCNLLSEMSKEGEEEIPPPFFVARKLHQAVGCARDQIRVFGYDL